MNERKFEHYLETIQTIAQKTKEDRTEIKTLFQCIDDWERHSHPHSDLSKFFKGEFYFYRGNYEQALKYYLEAKTVPHFSFFCYRASGYISLFRKDAEKALQYAEKAHELIGGDVMTLDLLEKVKGNVIDISLTLSAEELNFLEECPLSSSQESDSSHHEQEERIFSFHNRQSDAVKTYLDTTLKNSAVHEDCLYFFDVNLPFNSSADLIPLTKRATTGGFFIRWNQKGIAVNPGKGFLKAFHEAGLHLHHLDACIVTRSDLEAFSEIEEIYALNTTLNEEAKEPHIINYYLSPKASQELSPILKPHYKQERRSLHALELFIDSPDVEKTEIYRGITLHYFPIRTHIDTTHEETKQILSLGIRIDLTSPETGGTVCRLGYISGSPWSPMMAHHLGPCDVFVAGLGRLQPQKQESDCLGLSGTFSLLEEINPKLMILAEMSSKEGDIRMEATKIVRNDYQKILTKKHYSVIIPADSGLIINLNALTIYCKVMRSFFPLNETHVIKTQNSFEPLKYVSSGCCL